jgi:hypothetical protein
MIAITTRIHVWMASRHVLQDQTEHGVPDDQNMDKEDWAEWSDESSEKRGQSKRGRGDALNPACRQDGDSDAQPRKKTKK